MSVNTRKGPVYDPGLCRCCGNIKKCRLLNVEYEWMGQKEVYSDMFVDCFGLLLSHLDGEPTERLVCATCVTRLREASLFRRQVLQCEERLLKSEIHVHGDDTDKLEDIKKEPDVKLEVSAEPLPRAHSPGGPLDDVMDYDDDDPSEDFKPEKTTKTKKTPKQKKLKTQAKRKTKVKKKDKANGEEQKDREEMLESIAKISEQLKKMHEDELREKPPPPTRKDADQRALLNAEIIVQNSYVCPFDSSFSDYHCVYCRALFSDPAALSAVVSTSGALIQKDVDELRSKPPPTRKDADQRALLNAEIIVQNSYVCPFDSSFSDYHCVYCRALFSDPAALRAHVGEHDTATFKQHAAHKKLLQVDVFRIDCRLCAKRIDDLDVFKTHITTVHGIKLHEATNEFLKFRLTVNNLQCTECSSTFRYFHALKKHMAEHFGTCICDVCGAHYFEERMLALHQKSHQKLDEAFPCRDCGKTFKSKHSRYLHEARAHRKEPAYQCSKCDEVFFSYSLRYRHMIEAHGEQRMFPCERCDRAYDSRKSLREHNRRFHLKIFKHQCDLCEKRFYLPSRLREHMCSHTGERNYRCEYCGKSYPRLRGLKVHVQSHSAEKKYKCDLCTASFTQNVNLRTHVRRQHQQLDGYAE